MSIFVTSDLHLGHARIINFCNRPFEDVYSMNNVLINNWNRIIKPRDKVYFLGDLSFQSEYWIPKLNGNITFIRGNHDILKYTYFYNSYVLKYDGDLFYLVHDPKNIPRNWKGWSICGHNHHKRPFFDKDAKRFNISTDVTNYRPVNMNYISWLTKQ